MKLCQFDKIVITQLNERKNGRVIGVKKEEDGSETYTVQLLKVDFSQHKSGGKLIRLNSRMGIAGFKIEKHGM